VREELQKAGVLPKEIIKISQHTMNAIKVVE